MYYNVYRKKNGEETLIASVKYYEDALAVYDRWHSAKITNMKGRIIQDK